MAGLLRADSFCCLCWALYAFLVEPLFSLCFMCLRVWSDSLCLCLWAWVLLLDVFLRTSLQEFLRSHVPYASPLLSAGSGPSSLFWPFSVWMRTTSPASSSQSLWTLSKVLWNYIIMPSSSRPIGYIYLEYSESNQGSQVSFFPKLLSCFTDSD